MAIPFRSDTDHNRQQILNVSLHRATVHPPNPVEGQIYYNTTDDVIYVFDGSIWQYYIKDVTSTNQGLTRSRNGGVINLAVNTDNVTLEVDPATGVVRIKDLGVSTDKLADGAVTTIKVTDKNIVFSKMQDIPTMTVIGRVVGGSGVPSAIPILNENDMASNSSGALVTQSSVKAYVDNVIGGIGKLIGGFDASASSVFPSVATTKKGDYWHVTVAGTVQGTPLNIGDVLIANKAVPSTTSINDWIFLETNRDQATTTVLGVLRLATVAEVQALTDNTKAVTPFTLSQLTATETRIGLASIATNADLTTGTNDSKFVTPLKLKTYLDNLVGGFTTVFGDGTNRSFTFTHTLNTKFVVTEIMVEATGEKIITDITGRTATTVTVEFGESNTPTTGQYRIVIKK